MKKIFFALFLGLIVLSTNTSFARDEVKIEDDSRPSIKIEFNNMDKLEDGFEDRRSNEEKIEISAEDVGGAIAIGLGVAIFFFVLILASIVFWIAMLVHAVSKPIESKALWILILLLTGILGAIVYYFAIKRDFGKKEETIKAEKVE